MLSAGTRAWFETLIFSPKTREQKTKITIRKHDRNNTKQEEMVK